MSSGTDWPVHAKIDDSPPKVSEAGNGEIVTLALEKHVYCLP